MRNQPLEPHLRVRHKASQRRHEDTMTRRHEDRLSIPTKPPIRTTLSQRANVTMEGICFWHLHADVMGRLYIMLSKSRITASCEFPQILPEQYTIVKLSIYTYKW